MALSIHTAVELSKLPFIAEINLLKKEVDALRPLPKETEQKILQKFRLDWNYHSNAIEGNQLTYGETVAFIMEGVTAKGKTLKDHLDIKGHDDAVKYLLDLVKNKDYEINEAEIRNLHVTILKEPYSVDAETTEGKPSKRIIQIGQYKSFPNHVKTSTGETHFYASPEETPARMGDLMAWYKEAKTNSTIHPIVLATLFHHEFTNIHPFDDGNGRMGRLLMNLMLLQNDYTPVVVKQNDRTAYYQVLRQADAGEFIPITEYMSDLLKHSLSIYIKGAKGESIEEEDDIDKEIALFRKTLGEDKFIVRREPQSILQIIENLIVPFFDSYNKQIDKLADLFISIKRHIRTSCDSTILLSMESVSNDIKSYKQILADSQDYYQRLGNLWGINVKKEAIDTDFILITNEFLGYKKSSRPSDIISEFTLEIFDESFYRFSINGVEIFHCPYGFFPSNKEIKEQVLSEVRNLLTILNQE
jgi:Fic family protein